MKVDAVVKKETGTIAAGVLVLCMLMLAVYAFIGKLDYKVLLGTLLGALAAVSNFFLMALSVQKSAEKMNGAVIKDSENTETAEDGEEVEEKEQPLSPEAASAKKFMQASYTLRMLLLGIFIILAVAVPVFDPIPCLIVLLFPRLVIFAVQIIRNKKGASAQ